MPRAKTSLESVGVSSRLLPNSVVEDFNKGVLIRNDHGLQCVGTSLLLCAFVVHIVGYTET